VLRADVDAHGQGLKAKGACATPSSRCSGSRVSKRACRSELSRRTAAARRRSRGSLVARSPAVLLFDEPLSKPRRRSFRPPCSGRRSASCNKSLSLTVIYVTHDQEEALGGVRITLNRDGGADASRSRARRTNSTSQAGVPAFSPTSSAMAKPDRRGGRDRSGWREVRRR